MVSKVSETPSAVYECEGDDGRQYRVSEYAVYTELRSALNPQRTQRQSSKSVFLLDDGDEVQGSVNHGIFVTRAGIKLSVIGKSSLKP